MTAGFSLKKIKSLPSLGQKMKRARKRMKVSLLDAEMETRIRAKYLEALENDDWLKLPADTYTKGFVVRYARFLKLDEDKIYSEYKKQREIWNQKTETLLLPRKNVKEYKFVITSRFILPTAIVLVIMFVVGYIASQVYGFAAAPELQILSPDNNSIVDQENIEIKGVTDQSAKVKINDQSIQVSADGRFITEYKLQKGINIIQISSENKANRAKSFTYTIEYRPKTANTISLQN